MTTVAQLRLDFTDSSHVLCANGQADARDTGYVGPHHCAACAAEVDALCQAFAVAVRNGEYDVEGYTPADRRVQAKRREGKA